MSVLRKLFSHSIRRQTCLAAAFMCALSSNQLATANQLNNSQTVDLGHSATLDSVTEQVLNAMLSGNWQKTSELAQQLVDAFPDYALGHLILAEAHTVAANTDPLIASLPSYSKELIDLLLEARARVPEIKKSIDIVETNNVVSSNLQRLPSEFIQIGKHIDHVVLVDLASSDLYLFDTRTATPKLIKKHYISSGEAGFGKLVEGDLKTPLGVYRINNFRSDASLPSLYGSGALTLNYPNALDKALGRTGYGIWLHGNPPVNRSRSPRSSEGCVTMANDHLLDLHEQINIDRTKVVLTNDVQWIEKNKIANQRERFQELFTQYRNAWLNNNIDDLKAIYTTKALPSSITNKSNSDTPFGRSLSAFANVQLSEISIFMNPGAQENNAKKHFLMELELGGASSPRLTLYWEQTDAGFWQIRSESITSNGA